MRLIGALIFPGFELLDIFGPLEMFGLVKDEFEICMVAEVQGDVPSNQGPRITADATFDTPHKPAFHAAADNLLEDLAQDIAVAKAPVTVHREGRMVRNRVFYAQTAEPAVGQVQRHFLAQAPLRADRIAIADNQHPDHQLGAHRRTTQVAVMGRHLAAQPAQVQNRIDLA